MILDAIEDRIRVDITKLAHEWHCSVASKATLDGNDDDFEFHKKEATETFNLIGKLCLSWYKGWEGERDKLVEMYTNFIKQEKNPEFQKWRADKKKEMRDKVLLAEAEAKSLAAAHAAAAEYNKARRTRKPLGGKRF